MGLVLYIAQMTLIYCAGHRIAITWHERNIWSIAINLLGIFHILPISLRMVKTGQFMHDLTETGRLPFEKPTEPQN